MDHFALAFRPEESPPVPRRQASNAIQPQLPEFDEHTTLAVENSSAVKHPIGNSSVVGTNCGASACAVDSTSALLPSSTQSPLGFIKPLSGQPISVRIPSTNAVCKAWCEYTTQYLTYDPTIGMQVLPIPIDLLAEFIIQDAIKADTPLQQLAHICLVKYSCHGKGSREYEVVKMVWEFIQRVLH